MVMKKKKSKKKEDAPEFSFKEFTPEESRIYDEAIAAFREARAAGKKLKEAYATYTIADPNLRSVIQADFLKIVIAENHFGRRQSLGELAVSLDVPLDLLKGTLARMLQEVGTTAAEQFGSEFGSLAPETPATDD
jgi:hypothetical protein